MSKTLNFQESLSPHPKLDKIKDTISETMESLAVALERTIDSIGAFGVKTAEKIKQLGEKFKNFLLVDKEIILHSRLKTMLTEINTQLDQGGQELKDQGTKLYGRLQSIGDSLQTRLLKDPSYRKELSFLYTEDIKPGIERITSKLSIGK